jgi:hypothetical protein
MCRDYVFFFRRTNKRKTSCIRRFCLNNYKFHENITNFMHILKLSLIFLKKHDRRIRHDNIRHTRHIRHHSKSIYIFFASICFVRLFAARFFVMYNRSKIMWCWAIVRNRFLFDMRFESAVASRATKRTRTRNETRLRCDSKKKEKNRIRRRSKRERNRIRRCSKKEENDRIRRCCRRRFKDATNDSKFELLICLRANSTSTTTTIAYLINVAKHKKRILNESFFRLHLSSSEL